MSKQSQSHEYACTDPLHHVHDAGGFVKAVEQACEQRGLRLTPLRAQALALIAAETKPTKAYDLLDKMKDDGVSALLEKQAKAIGFTTRAQILEVHGTCGNCAGS